MTRVRYEKIGRQVRERVAEVIDLAGHDVLDVLDLLRSRAVEQEVLDLLDEPPAR